MLRSLKDIEGSVVSASNGESAKIADFLLNESPGGFAKSARPELR
jgi:hypothetical protein